LNKGKGIAWKGDEAGLHVDEQMEGRFDPSDLIQSIKSGEAVDEGREAEIVDLDDNRKLGIATLGSLKQHPRISSFRRFIEGWYLGYFTPDAARSLPLAGPQKNMRDIDDASRRILFENLPKLLKGYGQTFAGYRDYKAAVVLICDLDRQCLKTFRDELRAILDNCQPRPETRICIALVAAWPRCAMRALDIGFCQPASK
jgi:hypothetical protein